MLGRYVHDPGEHQADTCVPGARFRAAPQRADIIGGPGCPGPGHWTRSQPPLPPKSPVRVSEASGVNEASRASGDD